MVEEKDTSSKPHMWNGGKKKSNFLDDAPNFRDLKIIINTLVMVIKCSIYYIKSCVNYYNIIMLNIMYEYYNNI